MKSAGAPGVQCLLILALRSLADRCEQRREKFRDRSSSCEAQSAMGKLYEPHLTDRIVILIERQAIDADGDRTAASMRVSNRCEAGVEMQIGAEIGDDACTGGGDHVELVRPRMNAMRERQPVVTAGRCRADTGRRRPGNARSAHAR